MTRSEKVAFISNLVLLALLLGSFVYALVMCFVAPISSSTEVTKSNYMLTAFQSMLGIALLLLPYFLKKLRFDIPPYLKIILVVYVYAAIFLGEVQSFYYRFQHWDTICHMCSGMIFAILSFSFIYLMNSNKNVHLDLNPGFIAFFSFCFAVMTGVLWEILEFGIDTVIGTNMQKFIPETSNLFNGGASKEPLIGTDGQIAEFFRRPAGYKYALMDTMYDLIVDCIGSFIMSLIGYVALKLKKNALDGYVIKRTGKYALATEDDTPPASFVCKDCGCINELNAIDTNEQAFIDGEKTEQAEQSSQAREEQGDEKPHNADN